LLTAVKPLLSAEYLIIPYAEDKILVILQGYQKVPLSDSSVVRRIKLINYNIKYELIKVIKIMRVLLGNLMNSHNLISHYKIEKIHILKNMIHPILVCEGVSTHDSVTKV
jgi:ABC-type iron transport system FetAB permease component